MRKAASKHEGVLPHRRSLLRNDAVKRAPSKLHFRINTVGTTLGVGLDYKSTPAQRAAMNRLLERQNYHMRFAEPELVAMVLEMAMTLASVPMRQTPAVMTRRPMAVA